MGGMIAQELALRHPQRVDRLVLVGTYARPDAKRRMLLEKWRELARSDAPLSAIQVRERLLWTLARRHPRADRPDRRRWSQFFTRDGAPLSTDVFVRQCDACIGHDTRDRLREIHAAARSWSAAATTS